MQNFKTRLVLAASLLVFVGSFQNAAAQTHSPKFKIYKKYYASVLTFGHQLLDAGPTFTIEKTPSGQVVFHEYFFDSKVKILEVFYADEKMSRDRKSVV